MAQQDYNSQTLPVLGSDIYNQANEKPLTGTGGQTSYPESQTGVPSSAVITTDKVAETTQNNIQTIQNEKPKPTSDIESAMGDLAAQGKGQFADTPEGRRFINSKGDIYDMNGVIVGNQNTQPKEDKTQADAVTEVLGGQTLADGQRIVYAPNGVKLKVDKDGNILESDGSSLGDITNPYIAGQNISSYSELSHLTSAATSETDSVIDDSLKKLDDLYNNADERMKSSIARIQSMVESSVSAQREANKALEGATNVIGITSGRSRYAPDIQNSILSAQVSSGISKIADLRAKGEQLIQEAEQARDDNQFKILSEKIRQYQENKKQMFEESIKTQQLAMDLEKAAVENKKTTLENLKLAREEAYNTALEFVPSILESMQGMTPEEQTEFINNTAKESGVFDAITLKSAMDTYQRGVQQEMTKGISSYMADWRVLGGQAGTGKTFQQFYREQQMADNAGKSTGSGSGTGLSTLANYIPTNSPIYNALGLITEKFRFDNQVERAIINAKNGNTEALENQIDNIAQGNMKGKAITTFNTYSKVSRQVNNVLNEIDSMPEAEYNQLVSNYGTPVSRLVDRNWGPLVGSDIDPKLVKIVSMIGLAQAELRNEIYGATITDNEMGVANEFFVNQSRLQYGDSLKTAIGKLKYLQQYANEQRRALLDTYGGSTGESSPQPQSSEIGAKLKSLDAKAEKEGWDNTKYVEEMKKITGGVNTSSTQTKVVNGVTYVKVEGGWKKQ